MSACTLSPKEIAARKQRAAVEELKRNGIEVEIPTTPEATVVIGRVAKVRPKRRTFHNPDAPVNPAYRLDLPGIALNARATTGRDDFQSRPDAKPMSKADICNVQLLTREDAQEVLASIRLVAPEFVDSVIERIDSEWNDLLDNAERFTLSAYAARKYMAAV